MIRSQRLGLVLCSIFGFAGPVAAQIGSNLIVNGAPSTGIPYVQEGFEPTTDSGIFGDNWTDGWAHYRLRGIDHWKYERNTIFGITYHSLTFDYNTRKADMSYIFGDRYVAFIQGNNIWGDEAPVHVGRKVRTVMQFDVLSYWISGNKYYYPSKNFPADPMNFARMAMSTHPVMETSANTAITVDFDFWEKPSHLSVVSDPSWWYAGGSLGNDGTEDFPTEYFPQWDTNGSGVFVMPIDGMRENPDTMIHNTWVHVAIDLSWAYEWTLMLHSGNIEDAASYTEENPPTIWRIFPVMEGCNMRGAMQMRNIQINQYDLHDSGTLTAYRDLFDSTSTKSYPFDDHWLDYIQFMAD